jgi:formylmethanofuran dehydrogenase subunit C
MSEGGYELLWRGTVANAPVDGSVLRPDTLGAAAPEAIRRTPMRVGREHVELQAMFEVRGRPGPTLVVRGAPPLDRLGARMTSGTLWIDGPAGDDLAAGMWDGFVRVTGACGDRPGGPPPAERLGMRGGLVAVDAAAGAHAGMRMRAGFLAVGGPAGEAPGFRMGAGTVACGTGPLHAPGLEMQRGTVFCMNGGPLSDTGHLRWDNDLEAAQAPVIGLMGHELEALGWASARPTAGDRFRFWRGDRFEGDRGEVIQWLSEA